MDSGTLFRVHLTNGIKNLENTLQDLKRLLGTYDETKDKSGISQATIKYQFAQGELDLYEKKVLDWIIKSPRTRSELSTRFSRIFNSDELYGAKGVLYKFMEMQLIDRVIDETKGRPVTWYRLTKEFKEVITKRAIQEKDEALPYRKEKEPELTEDPSYPKTKAVSAEEFEEISKKLKVKHGIIPGNEFPIKGRAPSLE